MKPRSLTLQAFQSFGRETTIDFESLARNGLFAIIGETGSGKTTIFDAMFYALYGELPGSREPSDVRSDFAASDLKTFVRLTFEANGEVWTIEREPKQIGKKDKGVGDTERKHSAKLYRTDRGPEGGGALTAIDEIAKRIPSIVGLSDEEFTQVVLLPQNEFQAVLLADATDRKKLLKKLFDIALYERFTNCLDDEVKLRAEASATVRNSVLATLTDLRKAELSIEVQLGSPGGIEVPVAATEDEKVAIIHAVDVRDETAQVVAVEQAIKELGKQVDLSARAHTAAQQALEAARALDKQFMDRDSLREQQRALSSTAADDAKLVERIAEYRQVDLFRNSLAAWESATNAYNGRSRTITIAQTALSKSRPAALKGRLPATESDLKSLRDRLREHSEALETVHKLTARIAARDSEALEASRRAEDFASQLQEAERELEDERVAIVAASLQDGKPCPVCGSREHPQPATPRDTVTPVKDLQERIREMSDAIVRERSEATIAASDRQRFETELAAALVELGSDLTCTVDSDFLSIKSDLDELAEVLDGLLSALADQAAATQEIDASLKTLDALMKKVGCDTPERLLRVLADMDQEAGGDLESLEEGLRERQQLRLTVEGGLDQLQRELKGKRRPDLGTLERQVASASEERDRLVELQGSVGALSKDLRQLLSDLGRGKTAFLTTEGALNTCKELSGVIRGTDVRSVREGASKQSLTDWLLISEFESVLEQANSRMRKMASVARYDLRLRAESGAKQKVEVFDIDVLDAQSGEVRRVHSLSGGEKFQAALAIALGLADVVSQGQNTELEALFIDEGFGSLDSKALNDVLGELIKLQQAGSRMVGVISHVGELKGRVASYIEVQRGEDGAGATVTAADLPSALA